MMCDFGTGNNNKLNWVLEDKQELIDIIETIYRGAKKGRGLVVSPKGKMSLSMILYVHLLMTGQIILLAIDTKQPRQVGGSLGEERMLSGFVAQGLSI